MSLSRRPSLSFSPFFYSWQGPKPGGPVEQTPTPSANSTEPSDSGLPRSTSPPSTGGSGGGSSSSNSYVAGQNSAGADNAAAVGGRNSTSTAASSASSAAVGSGGGEGGWSFARVTAMNGHFPTLSGNGPVQAVGNNSANVRGGAWGITAAEAGSTSSSSISTIGGGFGKGAWGTAKMEDVTGGTGGKEPAGGRSGAVLLGQSGDGDGGAMAGGANKKKKGKKNKGVPLFSNAGARGGR